MYQRHKSYLRPLRRQIGFTQQDVALLIGVKSRTVISRIEASTQRPSLDAIFIYAIVFDQSPLKLCPGLMSELHGAVFQRASELYDQLQGNPRRSARMRLDFLEAVLAQIEAKRDDVTV